MNTIKRGLLNLVGIILVALFSVMGGSVLLRLAGGIDNPNDGSALPFFLFTFWWVFALLLILLRSMETVCKIGPKKRWLPGPVSGLALIFYFAPILMNSVSTIANSIGWTDMGRLVFQHRFHAQPALIVMSVGALIILSIVGQTKQWLLSSRAKLMCL